MTISDDKKTGVDEGGNLWSLDKFWKKDYRVTRIPDDPTMHGIDRKNNMFSKYCDEQAKIAEKIFSDIVFGKDIQNPYYGKNYAKQIEMYMISRGEDPILQQAIKDEIEKAEDTHLVKYGTIGWDKWE